MHIHTGIQEFGRRGKARCRSLRGPRISSPVSMTGGDQRGVGWTGHWIGSQFTGAWEANAPQVQTIKYQGREMTIDGNQKAAMEGWPVRYEGNWEQTDDVHCMYTSFGGCAISPRLLATRDKELSALSGPARGLRRHRCTAGEIVWCRHLSNSR